MSASEKSNAIYTAFDRWLDTKSLFLIEKFTREELEAALIECELYKDMPPYLAMQGRVEKLKDNERRGARTYSRELPFSEKLKWALIGGLVTIAAGLIIIKIFWISIKHRFG